MKRIFASADEFIRRSDWKDLAIVKFCMFSIGLLVGLQITEKCKKGVRIAASVVFTLTYIPLMVKYLGILTAKGEKI